MSPFFSVVITTYNRPHLLPRAIKSVLDQTFKDFEIIVVNDGSKEDYTTVEKYMADIPVIKYLYTANQGRSKARNLGIAEAAGKYICFLDDDDIYYPNHLSILFEGIRNHKVDALYHTYCIRRFKDGTKNRANTEAFNESDNISKVIDNQFALHSVAIYNTILKQYQFDSDLEYYEDLDLWIRIAISFPIIKLKEYTVEYNFHDDNSTNWNTRSVLLRLHSFLYFKDKYQNYLPPSFLKKNIFNSYIALASFYANSAQAKKSLRSIFDAFKIKPSFIITRYSFSIFKKLLNNSITNVKRS